MKLLLQGCEVVTVISCCRSEGVTTGVKLLLQE